MKITRLDMPEDFTCHCGNHSHSQGFHYCTEEGVVMEDDTNWKGYWLCGRCGDVYLEAAMDTSAYGKAFGASKAVSAPGTPLTLYHGTSSTGPDKATALTVPAFFFEERTGAEWIASDRGGKLLTANLVALSRLDIRKPEGLDTLLALAAKAGVKFEKIPSAGGGWAFYCDAVTERFGQEGDEPLRLVLFPEVREALLNAGYDTLVGDEPLENDCVTTWVALTQQQILPAFPDWTSPENEVFGREMALVREQFPQYADGWRIVAAGIELVELEGSPYDVVESSQEIEEEEGLNREGAIEAALEKVLVTSWAPPGYAFLRLQKPGERDVSLMVKVGAS